MASYANFEYSTDTQIKTFHNFLSNLFGDCFCMSEIYEGVKIVLKDGKSCSFYMKDLNKVIFGDDYMRIISGRFDAPYKDVVIPTGNILFIEVYPPNTDRW